MPICVAHIYRTRRSQERASELTDSELTELTGGCELSHGFWGWNLDPLEEQPVLLTAESSLQLWVPPKSPIHGSLVETFLNNNSCCQTNESQTVPDWSGSPVLGLSYSILC